MAQNDTNFHLSHSLSQELYLTWLWFLVRMCKMIYPAIFFIFSKFRFFGFLGEVVKGQKMTHNYQFQSVTLYISTTVDHIIKIFVVPVVFLYFIFFLIQYCKYYNSYICYFPTSTVFLINSCFSSSAINVKQKF